MTLKFKGHSIKNICLVSGVVCYKRVDDRIWLEKILKDNGATIVDNPLEADLIVVFTCGVGEMKANMSVDKIVEMQKYGKQVMVVGCLPAIDKKLVRKHFKGVMIPTRDFRGGVLKVLGLRDEQNTRKDSLMISSEARLKNLFNNLVLGRKPVAKIKVQGGCTANCSYCAIKIGVGNKLKSKPVDLCVAELKNNVSNGFRRIVIGGDDVGAYGRDLGINITTLLDSFLAVDDDFELVLHDFNVMWLVQYQEWFFEHISDKKFAWIFAMVQSGSQKILKKMNRNYDLMEVEKVLKELKKRNKNLRLLTEVIVGFPGESEYDFRSTLDFVKRVKMDVICMFPFSMRPGVEAQKYANEMVDMGVIKQRIARALVEFRENGVVGVVENGDLKKVLDEVTLFS